MRNWLETITKIGAMIITVATAIFYLGANQANISNSISNNSRNINDVKKGNEKIIALLESVKNKQHDTELRVVENSTKIKFYLNKK